VECRCAKPFPEWELVIDEEPRERDEAPNPNTEAPPSETASKPGEQHDADDQVRRFSANAASAVQVHSSEAGFTRCVRTRAKQEEEGDEDDLADFEESLEQMHFSAFTSRVWHARGASLHTQAGSPHA
jgi:hypothetical protein